MKKTIITLAASILATLAIATPVEAASHSEAATRSANGIPSSITFIKGTSGWVKADIRCFEARATKRDVVQDRPVRKGSIVTYCTHGYVDRTKGTDFTRRIVINPGR